MSIFGAFTSLLTTGTKLLKGDLTNYSFGEKIKQPQGSIFEIFNGKNVQNDLPVTIFVYDKKNQPVGQSSRVRENYARTCLKYLKTLRHPYILRNLETVENANGIIIVTESVEPLTTTTLPTKNADPSWGLYRILSALQFLHNDAKLIHGLISPLSIYCTTQEGTSSLESSHFLSGQWVLGVFDCATESTMGQTMRHSIESHPFHSLGHTPPFSSFSTAYGYDLWGLARLAAWSHGEAHDNRGQELSQIWMKMSFSLKSPINQKLIKLENQLIKTMLFFEEINLKGPWDKECFFNQLSQSLLNIPLIIQVYQILPQLTLQLPLFDPPLLIFESILRISDSVLSEGSGDLYQARVVPALVGAFKRPDRALRYRLLEYLPESGVHFTSEDTDAIIDPILLGLTDSSNVLREATIKALVHLVPKLNKNKSLEKTQRLLMKIAAEDNEGSMRTNALICIANLSSYFSPTVLVQVILARLRDNFGPCRVAALQCCGACAGRITASDALSKVLPAVCLRALEGNQKVAEIALDAAETLLNRARNELLAPCPPEDGESAQPEEKNSSGWAGWAFRKAVAFYGGTDESSLKSKEVSGALNRSPPGISSPPPPSDYQPSQESLEADVVDLGVDAPGWADEAFSNVGSRPPSATQSVSDAQAFADFFSEKPPVPSRSTVPPPASISSFLPSAVEPLKQQQPLLPLIAPPAPPKSASPVVADEITRDFWSSFEDGNSSGSGVPSGEALKEILQKKKRKNVTDLIDLA